MAIVRTDEPICYLLFLVDYIRISELAALGSFCVFTMQSAMLSCSGPIPIPTNLYSLLLPLECFAKVLRSRTLHFVPVIRCHRHFVRVIRRQQQGTSRNLLGNALRMDDWNKLLWKLQSLWCSGSMASRPTWPRVGRGVGERRGTKSRRRKW